MVFINGVNCVHCVCVRMAFSGCVYSERGDLEPLLDVPQAGCVVHAARYECCAVRVELQAHYLRRMPAQCVVALAGIHRPQLTRLVE